MLFNNKNVDFRAWIEKNEGKTRKLNFVVLVITLYIIIITSIIILYFSVTFDH